MHVEELPFLPLGPAEGDATVFRCPLCSFRFTHGHQACPACPLSSGCDLVTCPNCGYGFPRSSRLVSWIRKIAARRRPDGGGSDTP